MMGWAAIALLLVFPAAVCAQEGAAPVPLLPPEEPPAETGVGPDGAAPATATDISTVELGEIDADAVGLLGAGQGGFGLELWRGSTYAQVGQLLARLPVTTRSPATHELIRRLLLSTAVPPERAGDGVSLIEARLATLAALGEFEAFLDLLAAMPSSAVTAKILRLKVDVMLFAGDSAGACRSVRNQVRESDDLYWQMTLIFCQVVAGQGPSARLSLSLLRDSGADVDPAFISLASVLLGEKYEFEGEIAPAPLTVAMLLAADIAVPDTLMASGSPAVLRAIADVDDLPLDIRLAAAEGAAATGALAAEELARLYRQVQFAPEELADAVTVAGQAGGAWARALLHQASRRQQTPTERAQVLAEMWRLAPDGAGLVPTARANAEALETLSPMSALSGFAVEAVRALLAADRPEAALAWVEMLAESAELDAEADRALAQVLPLAMIADLAVDRDWHPILLQRWWATLPETMPDADRIAHAGRLFMVLDSLGYVVGRDGWALLLSGPLTVDVAIPAIGIRYGMRDAARAERLGDALLLAQLALGEAGPAGTSPLALGSVIRSLRALGLDAEARRLGVEAVLEAPS
jgi:hypothetical protein